MGSGLLSSAGSTWLSCVSGWLLHSSVNTAQPLNKQAWKGSVELLRRSMRSSGTVLVESRFISADTSIRSSHREHEHHQEDLGPWIILFFFFFICSYTIYPKYRSSERWLVWCWLALELSTDQKWMPTPPPLQSRHEHQLRSLKQEVKVMQW